jgi:hypothetical protein
VRSSKKYGKHIGSCRLSEYAAETKARCSERKDPPYLTGRESKHEFAPVAYPPLTQGRARAVIAFRP